MITRRGYLDLFQAFVIVLILGGLVLLVYIVTHFHSREGQHAVVIERVYAPAASHVVVGTSGRTAVAGSGESWSLVLRFDDGSVEAYCVTAAEWASHPANSEWNPR